MPPLFSLIPVWRYPVAARRWRYLLQPAVDQCARLWLLAWYQRAEKRAINGSEGNKCAAGASGDLVWLSAASFICQTVQLKSGWLCLGLGRRRVTMGSRLNIRASRATGSDDVLEGVGPLPTLPPLPLLLLLLPLLLMRRGWRHLPSSPFRHNTVTCLLWSASTSRCCISQHGFMTHTQQTLTNGDSWCKLICAVLYLIHIFTL